MFLTLEAKRGEAVAIPTCQTPKLNWARNTPSSASARQSSAVTEHLWLRKGRVELCGLDAYRERFFLCTSHVHGLVSFASEPLSLLPTLLLP
jgi:hypothetical protein